MSALVYVLLALAAGRLVGRLVSGSPAYGATAATLAGIVGAVLVALPLGDQGPHLLQVAVLPASAGALAGAGVMRVALARLAVQAPSG